MTHAAVPRHLERRLPAIGQQGCPRYWVHTSECASGRSCTRKGSAAGRTQQPRGWHVALAPYVACRRCMLASPSSGELRPAGRAESKYCAVPPGSVATLGTAPRLKPPGRAHWVLCPPHRRWSSNSSYGRRGVQTRVLCSDEGFQHTRSSFLNDFLSHSEQQGPKSHPCHQQAQTVQVPSVRGSRFDRFSMVSP